MEYRTGDKKVVAAKNNTIFEGNLHFFFIKTKVSFLAIFCYLQMDFYISEFA